MEQPNALVLFGPPGAGKGTQASMLAQYPNVEHVSSGELSRNLAKGSELYRRFRLDLERSKSTGEVFPDETARDLLAHEIEHRGYGLETLLVLDGIPMTEGQVPLVDGLVSVEAVIELYANDDAKLIERMYKRAQETREAGGEPRRYDLDPERAKKRILRYRSLTEPAIDPYRLRGTKLFDIGALTGTPEQIHDAMVGWLTTTPLAAWFRAARIAARERSDYKTI